MTIDRAILTRAAWPALALVVLATLCSCSSSQTSEPTKTAAASQAAPTPSAAAAAYEYKTVAVSAACLDNMKRAQDLEETDVGQNPPPGDAEIKNSVNLCASVDELMSALSLYPGALGTESAPPSDTKLDIGTLCTASNTQATATSPVCLDATRLGLTDG